MGRKKNKLIEKIMPEIEKVILSSLTEIMNDIKNKVNEVNPKPNKEELDKTEGSYI